MAISVVGTPTSTSNTSVSSLTFAFDATGCDFIFVCVGTGSSDPTTIGNVTGITFNGDALTEVWAVNGTSWVRGEGWYLIAPDQGNFNVIVTFTAGSAQAAAGCIGFSGVHQSAPIGTANSGGGTGADPSVAVSSATGELVVGGIMSDDALGIAPLNSGTERWERENIDSDTAAASATWAGAASVTVQWDTDNEHYGIGGVSLKPAASAGGMKRSSSLTLLGAS